MTAQTLAYSRPLSPSQMREEHTGIVKALETRVTQYRIVDGTTLTTDRPDYANHVRYDTEELQPGLTVCFVDYFIRETNTEQPAAYYKTGGFRAWYEPYEPYP